MNQPLVVSFFTKDTPYEKEAEAFIASCKAHGIDYEVEGLESRGSWDLNCALKPLYLLKKLQEKKRPLLWVDIDGRILRPLEAHDWDSCDLALRVNAHLPQGDPNVFYAATVYCSYEPQTIRLLESWTGQCEEDLANSDRRMEVWDQQVLQNVLSRHPDVRLQHLPWKFAKVFDTDSQVLSAEETIIEHTQASRRLKKYVCKEALAKLRIEKIEEFLEIVDLIDMTCIVDVDDTTLLEVGSCLNSLVPFLKKVLVIGKFADFQNFALFSQIARIYPFIPFLLDEDLVKQERSVLRLRADQCLDGNKLFFWLFERRGQDLPPLIDASHFLDTSKKKLVDLSKHPYLAL